MQYATLHGQKTFDGLTVVLVKAIEESSHSIVPELDNTIMKTDYDPRPPRVCNHVKEKECASIISWKNPAGDTHMAQGCEGGDWRNESPFTLLDLVSNFVRNVLACISKILLDLSPIHGAPPDARWREDSARPCVQLAD
jgi:hypothetical protein